MEFTIETEKVNKLPFLDILIQETESGLETRVYKKKTDTGLLTNFNSFISFGYKLGLIRTLIDRVYKINSSWEGFVNDIDGTKLTKNLQKNEYPEQLINKNIK